MIPPIEALAPALFLSACMLILACTPRAPHPDDTPATLIDPPRDTAMPPAAPLLHRQFDAARAREPAAVLSPQATVSGVREISEADRLARDALRPLERVGHSPTRAELDHARAALQRLQRALAMGEREAGG